MVLLHLILDIQIVSKGQIFANKTQVTGTIPFNVSYTGPNFAEISNNNFIIYPGSYARVLLLTTEKPGLLIQAVHMAGGKYTIAAPQNYTAHSSPYWVAKNYLFTFKEVNPDIQCLGYFNNT